MRALVEGCIELGLTIIPRGGGTGYTGGAVPLTPRSAVINTEKLDAPLRDRAPPARPGGRAGRDDRLRRRRGDEARDGGGGSGRARLRRRPDVGGRVVHRRQRRDERRRQEGGAVGHGARQSRLVADGDSRRRMARSHADRPQSRQDPRRRGRDVRARMVRCRRHDARRKETLAIPGAAFRKAGLGKDVTDKFLAGLPGVQKEGCDGLITSRAVRAAPDAAVDPHRVPRVLRSGARLDAGDRRDQALPRHAARRRDARGARASRRALREGRGLCDQGEAPRPAEDGAARATSSATTTTAVAKARRK